MTSELSFIDDLRARLARSHAPNRDLLVPPGDDTAEVRAAFGSVLFAADMLMDGVHFELKSCGARLVGRKALAVNLSDIAAMAGRPTAAVVSLAVPRSQNNGRQIADEIMLGMEELASRFGVAIAGGDTNAWTGPLVVNVAVIGDPHPLGTVTRGGARVGDAILVTGPLGGSIHGRHLRFEPRVETAKRLRDTYDLHTMIDLSDGLGSDLRHILQLSRVGARLSRTAIPIHSDVALHRTPRAPLDHALSDGEDFELCLTLSRGDAERLLTDKTFSDLELSLIGEITPGTTLTWDDGLPITPTGYIHQL